MRCTQLNIARDSEEITTTLSRAVNARNRVNPKLPNGFCGNAASGVNTTMTVKELLSMKPSKIALNLRADISKLTSFDVAARVKWLNERYQEGASPKTIFD